MQLQSLDIFLFILSVAAIIIGLLLSGNGSGGGIAALSGQDIELFRKVKSRGIKKYLQISMFVIGVVIMIVVFVLLKTRGVDAPPVTPPPEPGPGPGPSLDPGPPALAIRGIDIGLFKMMVVDHLMGMIK
jgi:protein translocase SecG subunit